MKMCSPDKYIDEKDRVLPELVALVFRIVTKDDLAMTDLVS